MSLDNDKLKGARRRGNKLVAQCPACAEEGHDNTGEHLVIFGDGSFACVVHSGKAGRSHRQRIYELAGIEPEKRLPLAFRVPTPAEPGPNVIVGGVLGRLGRQSPGPQDPVPDGVKGPAAAEIESGVPSVPDVLDFEARAMDERDAITATIGETVPHDFVPVPRQSAQSPEIAAVPVPEVQVELPIKCADLDGKVGDLAGNAPLSEGNDSYEQAMRSGSFAEAAGVATAKLDEAMGRHGSTHAETLEWRTRLAKALLGLDGVGHE